MKKFFYLFFFPSWLYAQSYIPIANSCGNDGLCSHTSLILRNTSFSTVKQIVGSKTVVDNNTTNENKTEKTINPNETVFVDDVVFETVITNGNTVSRTRTDFPLLLNAGLEKSSAIYTYSLNGYIFTRFEVEAQIRAFTIVGDGYYFHRNRAVNLNGEGLSVVVMNTGNNPVILTCRVYSSDRNTFTDFPFKVPVGLSLSFIHGIDILGDVLLTVGTPSVGSGTVPPLYAVIISGPADGHLQFVRNGEEN